MHWWTKLILYFLSVSLLIACSSNNELDVESSELSIDPVERLVDHLIEINRLETPLIDSLLEEISTTHSDINVYSVANTIDVGKLLFSATHDSILQPLVKAIEKHTDYYRNYESYHIWKSSQLEFSLSPHPTEKWIFMVRN